MYVPHTQPRLTRLRVWHGYREIDDLAVTRGNGNQSGLGANFATIYCKNSLLEYALFKPAATKPQTALSIHLDHIRDGRGGGGVGATTRYLFLAGPRPRLACCRNYGVGMALPQTMYTCVKSFELCL